MMSLVYSVIKRGRIVLGLLVRLPASSLVKTRSLVRLVKTLSLSRVVVHGNELKVAEH